MAKRLLRLDVRRAEIGVGARGLSGRWQRQRQEMEPASNMLSFLETNFEPAGCVCYTLDSG